MISCAIYFCLNHAVPSRGLARQVVSSVYDLQRGRTLQLCEPPAAKLVLWAPCMARLDVPLGPDGAWRDVSDGLHFWSRLYRSNQASLFASNVHGMHSCEFGSQRLDLVIFRLVRAVFETDSKAGRVVIFNMGAVPICTKECPSRKLVYLGLVRELMKSVHNSQPFTASAVLLWIFYYWSEGHILLCTSAEPCLTPITCRHC